ncbi:flagellar filament capping protein FliD [Thauera butanivorans]|uniref:flagellar filament capping protein FliD n=1 Tax=Thauera butanivorans TaxID=86174 RepID=UPI000837CBC3|nr:flagellar filament capping protein FliD [Thauera butanivorans]
MAAITSGGSVLDITSIVSQLITAERTTTQQPLVTKQAAQTAKLSAFGQIKGALSSLQTAVDALGKNDVFGGVKATVSGKGFTATAKAGTSTGNHSIEVFQLAKEQRVSTDAATSFVPAAGRLSVQFGTVNESGNFEADAERMAAFEFEGGTLAELRDAINQNASLGIKATIVNNGKADQLVLTGAAINGPATGANMAFKLTGTDGLEGLSYDPGTGSTGNGMHSVQAAQDARLKVDGIEISRGKNTIDDVLEGVTLTLNDEPEADVASLKGTLALATDNEAARNAIDAFIKAYNEVTDTLKSLTTYDATTRQGSTLTGDSTVRNIQSTLRNALNDALGGLGGVHSLAELGISSGATTNKETGQVTVDGKLSLDSSKFEAALSNPDKDMTAFFAGKDGAKGFAATFSERLTGLLDSNNGLIATRTKGIDDNIKALEEQYNRIDERIVSMEERYRLEFSRLDTLLAGMSQTSSYLAQQLANLPKIGN